MTSIPDYFLDELIYKNYENRSRETFRLDPLPGEERQIVKSHRIGMPV
jgi:hypothetical protein